MQKTHHDFQPIPLTKTMKVLMQKCIEKFIVPLRTMIHKSDVHVITCDAIHFKK